MGNIHPAAAQAFQLIGPGGTDAVFLFTGFFLPDEPESESPSPVDAEVPEILNIMKEFQLVILF
jgi:hypothetical protein